MSTTIEVKKPQIDESWLSAIGDEFEKPYMKVLKAFLSEEVKKHTVYPPGKDMFNAFNYTPFDQVKVVIIGQDPYHGPNQAHGLCFSVQKGVPNPPSLQNIFREIKESLGIEMPKHGCLESWAYQGVFLLNASLSVRAHQANSHSKQGWEKFTDRAIKEIAENREGIVFMLWGAYARKKAEMIDQSKHLVLEAPHPSPLSAHRGFFGCGHFKKANEYLESKGMQPIDWALAE